jgi:2-isopropylmalate synthase
VRILDERHGTGAVTRVLLDSSDGTDEWGSIGVSENIIEASWDALVDSLEYAFQPKSIPLESSAPARSHPHDRS